MIHRTALLYGNNILGKNCQILENVIIGYPDSSLLNKIMEHELKVEEYQFDGVIIGENALIRTGTIIYCSVRIGKNFKTGHHVLIREDTIIGNNVSIGTNSIIEGKTSIGNNVNIQSNVFIPINTTIEDFVFIAPNVVLTNDKYPPFRKGNTLRGATLKRGVSVGANAIILPGVEIGEGSMISAGAIVTRDVPNWKLAIGCPAKIIDLPEELKVLNKI